ncbi:MAG: SURF1 family protein [Anaerolineales bacterium]|nr:SURF1 family protein [Anaerolineales bacterium]MDW8278662.1 SURF1 family protein [Anaerolineales bacterium]
MNLLLAMFSRKWWFTTLLVLLGSAVCVRLGIWQLDRLEQRRAFNAHYLAMTALPPLDLNAVPREDLTRMEYRAVTVTGVFDFDHQVALRNRYYQNEYGYHLLTPLVMADGSAVLVERGWIPAQGNAAPADWRKYDQPGEQTISGIIRLGQTKPDVGGVPDPELAEGQNRLDFWNIVNLERISLQTPYPLLPVFIQPNPDDARGAPPYPYQPEIEITEGPHFGYALQWFTFASILFFGYPFYLRKAAL